MSSNYVKWITRVEFHIFFPEKMCITMWKMWITAKNLDFIGFFDVYKKVGKFWKKVCLLGAKKRAIESDKPLL